MADHEEYKIRRKELDTNPFFKNFKEGFWLSPKGTKIVKAIASYEATAINISDGPHKASAHTSIYPVVWDMLFSEWTYIGETV